VAPPFRKTEFDILFDEGISYFGDLVDLGALHKVLEKSGTWFSYGPLRIGQGREKAIEFLKANRDVAAKVDAQIREVAGKNPLASAERGETPAASGAAAGPVSGAAAGAATGSASGNGATAAGSAGATPAAKPTPAAAPAPTPGATSGARPAVAAASSHSGKESEAGRKPVAAPAARK